jgi:outer membrane receptor protein involved in Fe transport
MMCGLALGLATPASAQDAEDQSQPQAGPVEAADPSVSSDADPAARSEGDIVVTGSRIPQPNLTSVSPVTVVNSQEIKLTGTTRTEDLLNALPQVFAGQGGNLANGASGTATLDLRGLGPQRTLVLINGRRLHAGDPNSNNIVSPDINIIPAAMVERVDVLTGGASSVYGSDAVAGVVNFVMDTDFEGIRFDGQYSFYNHDNRSTLLRDGPNGLLDRGFGFPGGTVADGGSVDLNMVIGAGFDDGRGHVVAYAGYRKIDAVTQDKRDYSACASQARTAAQIAAGNLPPLFCGGSATSANGTIFDWASTAFQIGANRTLLPGFTPFNFAPTNYYQRPDERYSAGFFANYEISRSLRPYMEFMFMDDRTLAQIAASGNFGNTYSINCDNPLLSAQQRAILCAPNNLVTEVNPLGFPLVDPNGAGDPPLIFTDPTTGLPYVRGFAQIFKRNVEGGPRIDDLRHTHYRAVVGMRGELGNAWSYDASYQYGSVLLSENFKNDVSISRLTSALDVVDDPRTAAIDPVCRVFVTGQDVNCVPYDIFQLNGVSQAAIDYVSIPAFLSGTIKQSILTGSLTGDLGSYGVQFPWAESGVGVALGIEYRKESLTLETDAAYQAGDLSGQGGASLPVDGAFDVREAFAEARIPIVENGFIDELSLELGYRYSDYSLKGTGGGYSTDSWKIGAQFAPTRDIRFRGSYNRAVRAPNIQELFAPRRVALNGAGDPCAGAVPTASLAACQAMDVTAAQYGRIAGNPAGQYNGLIGGTATLVPETATTKTVGFVLQPSFLPRFALTVDWFDIKIDDTIGQIGQDATLAACVATLDPAFCNAVVRDSTGSLWRSPNGYVVDVYTNVGGTKTRGIDLGASYNMDLGNLGGLGFQMVGTWLDKLIIIDGINPPYDCTGLYGATCLVPSPEWRHRFRVTYTTPDGLAVSLNWRHISAVKVDRSSDAVALNGAFAPANERLPSMNYFDLALTARVGDHYSFRLGVNNLLDKDPPIFGSNGVNVVINACPGVICSGNTFPQVYDAMGRYIFAGVTLDF